MKLKSWKTSAFVIFSITAGIAGLPSVSLAQEPAAVELLYQELAALPPQERQERLEEGARAEGVLNIIHSWRGELAQGHIDLFTKRYPFIEVRNVELGSPDAAERLLSEETVGRHLTDLVTIELSDITPIMPYIAKYDSPATDLIKPRWEQLKDADNYYVPFYWTEHGISYNTSLVPADIAPQSWEDLCRPEFRGKISFDPAEARFLLGVEAIMGEEKLIEWLKCIGDNEPIIQRGHTQRLELMLAGDHWIQGDNYLYKGLQTKDEDPSVPFQAVWTAPVFAGPGVWVINKAAEHPYAAALYTDWSLSEESQKYTNDQYRGPVAGDDSHLPAEAQTVVLGVPDQALTDRVLGYWDQYVARR